MPDSRGATGRRPDAGDAAVIGRDVRVERDREWFVIVTERPRRGKPPRVNRLYLYPDEAAQVAELLRLMLPEVIVRKTDARHQEQ